MPPKFPCPTGLISRGIRMGGIAPKLSASVVTTAAPVGVSSAAASSPSAGVFVDDDNALATDYLEQALVVK